MMKWILAVVVGVPLLAVATVMAASEFGGEVVTLYTHDAAGEEHATHLWVVDEGDELWLRAGMPDSGWLERIAVDPQVEVERAGARGRYLAVPFPERRDMVHRRMAEEYGWADTVVGLMRDGSKSVAVRLDPI